jgi:endonuclease YncB( thermonuclease family)
MELPMIPKDRVVYCVIILLLTSLACSFSGEVTPEPTSMPPAGGPPQPGDLETATVAKVVDGDTIELSDGRKVRYIGINTPERDQPYYQEAAEANRRLVDGKDVQLVGGFVGIVEG